MWQGRYVQEGELYNLNTLEGLKAFDRAAATQKVCHDRATAVEYSVCCLALDGLRFSDLEADASCCPCVAWHWAALCGVFACNWDYIKLTCVLSWFEGG